MYDFNPNPRTRSNDSGSGIVCSRKESEISATSSAWPVFSTCQAPNWPFRSGGERWTYAQLREAAWRTRCLAARDLHSMLAHRAVIAARERHDEIVRVRGLGGGHDLLFAGIAPTDCNVVAYRAAEQKHVLADIGELTAQ